MTLTDSNGSVTFIVNSYIAQNVALTIRIFNGTDFYNFKQIYIYFLGVPALNNTNILSTNSIVRGNGIAQSRITIVLRDNLNNLISGHTISCIPNAGTSSIVTTDNITFTPPSTVNITVTNNRSGIGITNEYGLVSFTMTDTVGEIVTYVLTDTTRSIQLGRPKIMFTGLPVASLTEIIVTPANVPADGSTPSNITVLLRDNNNLPLFNKSVQMVVIDIYTLPTIGAGSGYVFDPVYASIRSDINGKVVFAVTNPIASTSTFRLSTIGSRLEDNVVLGTVSVNFIGLPTISNTITVPGLNVPANDNTESSIMVTLKDANNLPIPNTQVYLSNIGNSTITNVNITDVAIAGTITSDENGTVTFKVRNSYSENVNYTINAIVNPVVTPLVNPVVNPLVNPLVTDNSVVVGSATVQFFAPPTSAVIEQSLNTVQADGITKVRISILLYDRLFLKTPNITIALQNPGNSIVTAETGYVLNPDGTITSDVNGYVIFNVTNTTTETVTYKVVDTNNNNILTTVTVAFSTSSIISFDLKSGWNLIGTSVNTLPLPSNSNITSIFQYTNNNFSTISTTSALTANNGYWIFVTGSDNITLNLSGVIPTNISIILKSGWNLIGTSIDTLPLTSNVNITSIFQYTNNNFSSIATTSALTANNGYWIFVTGTDDITINLL